MNCEVIESCEDCPNYDAMNGGCVLSFSDDEQLCPMAGVPYPMKIVPKCDEDNCAPTVVCLTRGGWTVQNVFCFTPIKPGVLEIYELPTTTDNNERNRQ